MAQSLEHAAATPDALPRDGRMQIVCHQRPVCGDDTSMGNSASARGHIRLEKDGRTVTAFGVPPTEKEVFKCDFATGANPTTDTQQKFYLNTSANIP